jgi:hypothetical protein
LLFYRVLIVVGCCVEQTNKEEAAAAAHRGGGADSQSQSAPAPAHNRSRLIRTWAISNNNTAAQPQWCYLSHQAPWTINTNYNSKLRILHAAIAMFVRSHATHSRSACVFRCVGVLEYAFTNVLRFNFFGGNANSTSAHSHCWWFAITHFHEFERKFMSKHPSSYQVT